MRIIYLLFLLSSFLSCKSSDGDSNSAGNATGTEETGQKNHAEEGMSSDKIGVEKELEGLTADSKKITFQRLIIKSDLDARKEQTKVLQSHGYNSPEYKEATKVVEQTDKDNLTKTVGFIEMYGISDNQSVGRMQANAMWLVISHCSDIDIYREVFSAFEKAWKMEYLEESSFASYLQDFHQLKFGKRLELKNPYRSEDEIKALMKELKIEVN